jgi:hypothetical protein
LFNQLNSTAFLITDSILAMARRRKRTYITLAKDKKDHPYKYEDSNLPGIWFDDEEAPRDVPGIGPTPSWFRYSNIDAEGPNGQRSRNEFDVEYIRQEDGSVATKPLPRRTQYNPRWGYPAPRPAEHSIERFVAQERLRDAAIRFQQEESREGISRHFAAIGSVVATSWKPTRSSPNQDPQDVLEDQTSVPTSPEGDQTAVKHLAESSFLISESHGTTQNLSDSDDFEIVSDETIILPPNPEDNATPDSKPAAEHKDNKDAYIGTDSAALHIGYSKVNKSTIYPASQLASRGMHIRMDSKEVNKPYEIVTDKGNRETSNSLPTLTERDPESDAHTTDSDSDATEVLSDASSITLRKYHTKGIMPRRHDRVVWN